MAIQTYGKKSPVRDFRFNKKYLFYALGGLFLIILIIAIISSSRGVERISLDDSVYEPVTEEPVKDTDSTSWVKWVALGYLIFMVVIIAGAKMSGMPWE